jgi:hypothetical protein
MESLMGLVEKAWGSEMFPDMPRVKQEVESRKSKLWNQYPRLIDKTFDKNGT